MPYEKCINIEQENAIEELKSRIEPDLMSPGLMKDEAILYKFLKARDFDIDKAEKLLRKHIAWRKVFKIDEMDIFKPKEVFVKYVEPNFVGYDKDGDLVIYVAAGRINTENYFKCMKMNDCVRHWIWFAEKCKRLANESGRQISLTVIADLDELELANATSKLTIDIVVRVSQVLRDSYAERLKAAYVINAPSYFVILYNIIKPILTGTMRKRLHIFGCSGWEKKMLEAIDANVLPAFLGGNRTDPDGDPKCKSFISLPWNIPESCHLSEKERYFENPAEVTTIEVPALEKKEIFIDVKEPRTSIRCKFLVRNKTIRFGLFLQLTQKEVKELLPMYEYDTSDGTEEHFHKCLTKGIYLIVFDNSHSRFRSKEVQYTITVLEPEN